MALLGRDTCGRIKKVQTIISGLMVAAYIRDGSLYACFVVTVAAI